MAQYRGSIGRVGHSNVQKAIMVINSHDLAIMFRGTALKGHTKIFSGDLRRRVGTRAPCKEQKGVH